MFQRTNYRGFTLLEVLIAMFIFTIVSILMVSGLRTVMQSQTSVEAKADRLSQLQTTLLLLSRDLEQSIDRSITNNKGITEPAFLGTPTSLHFTRTGFANPLGELQRSNLQRVGYSVENETFFRETWDALDQTAKSISTQRKLIGEIKKIRFEYLNEDGRFETDWPPNGNAQTKLPHGVRVHLTIDHWGDITQLYLLPATGGLHAKTT